MANYQETEVAGSSYIRSHAVHLHNPLDAPGLALFEEQRVYNLSDGKVVTEVAGSVGDVFDPNTAGTTFPILNPKTGEPIGGTSTYIEVYTLLHSLYIFLAKRRDEPLAATEPTQESTPAGG